MLQTVRGVGYVLQRRRDRCAGTLGLRLSRLVRGRLRRQHAGAGRAHLRACSPRRCAQRDHDIISATLRDTRRATSSAGLPALQRAVELEERTGQRGAALRPRGRPWRRRAVRDHRRQAGATTTVSNCGATAAALDAAHAPTIGDARARSRVGAARRRHDPPGRQEQRDPPARCCGKFQRHRRAGVDSRRWSSASPAALVLTRSTLQPI